MTTKWRSKAIWVRRLNTDTPSFPYYHISDLRERLIEDSGGLGALALLKGPFVSRGMSALQKRKSRRKQRLAVESRRAALFAVVGVALVIAIAFMAMFLRKIGWLPTRRRRERHARQDRGPFTTREIFGSAETNLQRLILIAVCRLIFPWGFRKLDDCLTRGHPQLRIRVGG